ncbi:radical SAM protein [bacterium]|nr:MAG: radical SAM protein [bacterium]
MNDIDPLLTDDDIRQLRNCNICPRECGVDRLHNRGVCGADYRVEISSANLHYGEEPPISGFRGSGTIFLTHCNLSCIYCQNYPISQMGVGKPITIQQLVDTILKLQRKNAHNINFVTPSHYAVQIRRAIIIARENGLNIPIVYNTSGYDKPETLDSLDGLVEIFMPDLRYYESSSAEKYSGASNYAEISRKAVKKMHSIVGELTLNPDGIAEKGLLIRLLVLPENLSGTDNTLRWIAQNLGTNTYISLMSQYFPAHKANRFPPLNRRITKREYNKILNVLSELGFQRGYTQPIP